MIRELLRYAVGFAGQISKYHDRMNSNNITKRENTFWWEFELVPCCRLREMDVSSSARLGYNLYAWESTVCADVNTHCMISNMCTHIIVKIKLYVVFKTHFVHMCLMYVMFIEHLTARVTAINACTVVRGSAAHLSGQSAGGTDDQSARTWLQLRGGTLDSRHRDEWQRSRLIVLLCGYAEVADERILKHSRWR